jgi:hypothetical protein
MHSLRWNKLLFQLPMAICLGLCILGTAFTVSCSPKHRIVYAYSREWTFQRLQWVTAAAAATWVPSAVLAVLVALDEPAMYTVFVVLEALCTGFGESLLVVLCFVCRPDVCQKVMP